GDGARCRAVRFSDPERQPAQLCLSVCVMKCPICSKTVELPSEFAPFCSERCKLIDLGNWASERYVISTPIKPSDSNDPCAGMAGDGEA
ncbi:MAG TPA: DNA gyrase inhibitor YacG, partial [Bryobacteraceae bacterium]|nr:DNA gyrase inhibitor YacG [Bryobacteraceae bacterium]